MEMRLNMGAFEALDSREMMEVDGGAASPTTYGIGFGIGRALREAYDFITGSKKKD